MPTADPERPRTETAPAAAAALLSPPMPPPLRSRPELRRDAEDRVLGLFVDLRAFGAPVIAGAASVLALLDDAPWRRAALIALAAGFLVFSVFERARLRRVGPRAFGAPLDLAAIVVAQLALVFASGGLGSPFAPTLLLIAFFQGLYASSAARASLAALVQVPAVWAMAWVHADGVGPDLVPRFLAGHLASPGAAPGPYVYAAVLSFPLVVAPQVARRVRHRLEDTWFEALTARDRSLALYAEQTETLTRLGAEIAHELKNPLASIKGLGALLARGTEGRDGERLAVLRREADRMQRVLDELLAFGRPVVPLEAGEVDLRDLADEVVGLHEGIAAERGVRLERAPGDRSPAVADPRKVLQVLTNLVQNALEATPAGGHVLVRAAPGHLEVVDDGPGVDPAVGERAFEPGVSTRARGTGLGLTIARALARQHGGALDLGPRVDGRPGARAVLTLTAAAPSGSAPSRSPRNVRDAGGFP